MAKETDFWEWCFGGRGSKGFPTLAVILLAVGVLWLLGDLNIIPTVSWWPVILIIVALGWIIDHYKKR